jgi:hypothetical protein
MASTSLELIVANDLAKCPTPLSEKNVLEWKYWLDIALASGGVWDDFFEKTDGKLKDAPTDGRELMEWNRRKALACTWVRKAAGPLHESTVESYLKAKEPLGMRDALIALYQTQSSSSRFKCWLDLTHFTRSPNEDYTSVFARVDALIQQLERLTPDGHTVQDMRKEIALFTCLGTIDTKHPFHATVSGDQSLTYSSFKTKVRFHESTAVDPSDKLQNSPVISALTSRLEHASLARDYTCYWCDEEGHSFLVCEKMKAVRSQWRAALNTEHTSRHSNPTVRFHSQSSNDRR